MFVFGFLVLTLQPVLFLNPEHKGMLCPSTIFNTVTSFMTNTNLQDYSGEVHLSYFSQVVFIVWNMFVSAAVGFCVLAAITRGLRGDRTMGNFYLDMWRVVMYAFLPLCFLTGVMLIAGGVPMTFEKAADAATLEKEAMGKDDKGAEKPQVIARGPVAAVLPIKHLGTNGGGFFGANSAHPFENPNAWTNYLETISILLFPLSLIVMFGRMLGQMRQALVIYGVMLLLYACMVGWSVHQESRPNPGLLARPAMSLKTDGIDAAALPPLPVDQTIQGNLEGKELR
jgi:K+-transporting ATPase ATPase A chain